MNLINNHSGDLGDQSTQLFFRMEAEDLINGLTILEGDQRRDRHNAIALGNFREVINVDLDELYAEILSTTGPTILQGPHQSA